MKFLKIKLFVFVLMMFAASSAFATVTEFITVNTSSLATTVGSGYIYLQYNPFSAASSTATVSNFTLNGGALGLQDTVNVANGGAVTGTLPMVVFNNTNGINDYLQAITFGSSFSFDLSFSNLALGGQQGGSSAFSLGLFGSDESTPLLNVNDPNIAGTGLTVNLGNDGTVNYQVLDPNVNVPEPATVLLFGFGLAGLAGIKRKYLA